MTFVDLATNQGHVQVSKYGSGAGVCHPSVWGPVAGDLIVDVVCYDMTGAALDTAYDVQFKE